MTNRSRGAVSFLRPRIISFVAADTGQEVVVAEQNQTPKRRRLASIEVAALLAASEIDSDNVDVVMEGVIVESSATDAGTAQRMVGMKQNNSAVSK